MRLLVVMLVLAVTACAAPPRGGDAPPPLAIGRDICTRCGMIIEDARFASGYTSDDGSYALFDDIGGMLQWAAANGELHARMWVHDFDSRAWIDAATATYVRGALESPMGFGITAFGTHAAATAFSDLEGGDIYDWDGLLALAESGDLVLIPIDTR